MQLSDIQAPDTPVARAALAFAARHQSPSMQNHVIRSWIWAEAFAAIEGRTDVDHELLYVSAMLHDIGLAPAFDNVRISYEQAGGHVAEALTTGAGWTAERSQRALDVIIRHNWPSVDPEFDQEGYLLEIATGLDISGARPEGLPTAFMQEVLQAHPRLSLAEEFGAGVVDQAKRKPHTSAKRLADGGVVEKLRRNPLETLRA